MTETPWGFSANLNRELRGKRWRLTPAYDENGDEIPDLLRLIVTTPNGTGPKAAGYVLIAKELADHRQLLAFNIRSARLAASLHRKNNPPPPWYVAPQSERSTG